FGVARIHGLGGEKTETGIFKGKLPYMPPEQALGEPFDGRADLFSLGVTLFEALIGGRLRKAETQGQLIAKIATERVPLVHEVVPEALPPLAQAIDAATAFRASERFPTSGHLATTMNHVLHAMGPGAEESAFAELAERVALVAGASTAPTTKQPWSLALSGEVPAFGQSGSNPRAMHTTGSGGYALGVPPPPTSYPGGSGPHSSASFSQRVPPGSGPPSHPVSSGGFRTIAHAPAHTHEVPPSVPPDRAASVTRIASITDAQRPKPSSRAWVVALSAAAIVGILAGAFWVVVGGGAPGAGQRDGTDVGAARTPVPSSGPTAVEPPKSAAVPSSSEPVAMTEPSSSASSGPDGKDPTKRPKTIPGPGPGPKPQVTATSEPTDGAPGTLQVNVSPWGHVSVDGKSYGTTPIGAISLPPGPHTVTVTNPDLGASRSATVKIVSGKGSGVSFDLKKSQ
ncbi:MAG: PEGA domain-containing protein, partial [Polyangiaceae bacterium]|nr:PEGA domain-containing protein [Polyangiaceae bacterium]